MTEMEELKKRVVELETKVVMMQKFMEAYQPLSGSTLVLDSIASFRSDTAVRFESLENRMGSLEKGMRQLLNYWKIGDGEGTTS